MPPPGTAVVIHFAAVRTHAAEQTQSYAANRVYRRRRCMCISSSKGEIEAASDDRRAEW
jgi:hypothetical protein